MNQTHPHSLEPDRNRALTNLLSTFSLESKQRMLAEAGIHFKGAYYAAIRVSVYDLPGRGTDLPDERLLEMQHWLREATEAALQPLCTAYFVAPEFYALALFLAFPEGLRIEQQLTAVQAAMVQAFRQLAATHQMFCYCAMSQPITSLEALPLAYQQACDLSISQRNTCIHACYLAGQDASPGRERLFLDVLRQLISLLSAHQFAEIPNYLRQQYLSGNIQIADFRYVNALLENYTSKYMGSHPLYPEALRHLARLSRHFYFQFQVDDWYTDTCALFAVLDAGQEPTQTRNIAAGAKIAAYLVEHQYDPELNLNLLADVFHLSASYISRAFKQYTGLTMMEFLTNLRLNRARELLYSTTMSIQDIACAVGYTPDTLSRVFRRTERMSPSQYRAKYRGAH